MTGDAIVGRVGGMPSLLAVSGHPYKHPMSPVVSSCSFSIPMCAIAQHTPARLQPGHTTGRHLLTPRPAE